jgi:hypothetical protein
MKMPSTTDLACPGLHCALRHGDVKDVPADPEAAVCIGASVDIREVPAPQSAHASGRSKPWRRAIVRDRPSSHAEAVQGWPPP